MFFKAYSQSFFVIGSFWKPWQRAVFPERVVCLQVSFEKSSSKIAVYVRLLVKKLPPLLKYTLYIRVDKWEVLEIEREKGQDVHCQKRQKISKMADPGLGLSG